MSDSIRERIINAIKDRLAIIRTDNGFLTDCGENVFRAARMINPDQLDAVAIFPKREEARGEFDNCAVTMPVDIQAIAAVDPGESSAESESEAERSERVSKLIEMMLADIIEAMIGDRWTLTFSSGSREPVAGDTVTGATSAATGYVESVSVLSGSWSGGDASGTIKIRRRSGTFAAENIDIGSETNVATISATVTRESAINLVTDYLADGIYYQAGGVDDYPEANVATVAVLATFAISYPVKAGNPFAQP